MENTNQTIRKDEGSTQETEMQNPTKKQPIRTNWQEIDEAIRHESRCEDCMIPMRDRCY